MSSLATGCRPPGGPSDTLHHIEAAAGHWRGGDKALANFRLVFSRLPRLAEPADAWRLRAAEYLLDAGMSPRELMKELTLDASSLDLADPPCATSIRQPVSRS